MARKVKGEADKRSRKWLQILIASRPSLLDSAIRASFGWSENIIINWQSPLECDGFAEYSDAEFLDRLNLGSLTAQLAEFWPARGPEWDALATTSDSRILLLEAKAHIPEVVGPGTLAGTASRKKIETSLAATRENLGVAKVHDRTGPFYQYANRIAHLHFLRHCGVNAYLINLYFANAPDVGRPCSIEEWHGAIQLVHAYLGLGVRRMPKYMADVFIDVNDLPK